MLAKEIMTKDVITVKEDAAIDEVMKILIDHKISGVPVLDERGDIIGIVTEKDLLVAFDFTKNRKSLVTEFMTREVFGIDAETPIAEISRLLVKNNIKRVPVLKGKRVLGIVSRRNVLQSILKET